MIEGPSREALELVEVEAMKRRNDCARPVVVRRWSRCRAPASAQVDFSGTWTLDREMSADLTKATFEPQQAQTPRTGGFTGGFGGRGFGGRSGGGGRPAAGDNTTRRDDGALTVDERARLREFADYVKGFTSIVIEHTDHSTFTVTDAQGRSRLFPTDGTKTPARARDHDGRQHHAAGTARTW